MFFHRARPEPEWRGERGVSEVTVRTEVLFEGEREFQAIRQDLVDDGSPQPGIFSPPDVPENHNKIRKKLNFFRRRKDTVAASDAEPNEASEAIEKLHSLKLQSGPRPAHGQNATPSIVQSKEPYRGLLFRRKDHSEPSTIRPSKPATTTNKSVDYYDTSTSRTLNGTRESSEETHSTKDRSTSYSGFGAKKARGFFSRNKSHSKSIEEEDKTPTPLKHGIKSLMKVAQENPEDSPLHGSPTAYEGTSISESFSWRDNSTRGDPSRWNHSCADSPSNASSTSNWEVIHGRDNAAASATITSPNSTQSTLDRRRGLFAFRRDASGRTGSLRNARKVERKRGFARTGKKAATNSDREATEQLNQMISLVANADDGDDDDEDDNDEDLDSRFSWVESQMGRWPSAAHSPCTPLSSREVEGSGGPPNVPADRVNTYADGGDCLPSPASRLSDWSAVSNARRDSAGASFDSLRTVSPDSQQQLSTATDDWVADFSVFDTPHDGTANGERFEQQPQSAVELRAHLATAERLLNTSKDSVESITSRDNMSPLPWTPQNVHQYNAMPTRATVAAAATAAAAGRKSKQENQLNNKVNDLPAVGKETERRSRQRPRSWFRGAKGDADVFREAQTLLDILHETFPEGDIDSSGSDLRTVY